MQLADPVAGAVLASWSFDPTVLIGLALATLVYLRGFAEIRVQLPVRFPVWRRGAFLAGIGVLCLALVSPLDAFADLLLQVHMLQHWLLMMVAPPLLWLGAPTIPLLRGLPRRWLSRGLGPLLAWRALRRALHRLTRPVVAGSICALTTIFWHLPFAYEAALHSRAWHDVEHGLFLAAALLFWYPVFTPWPARPRRERLGLVLYLAAAGLFNTLFSSIFAFSTRPFYPSYVLAPRLWGIESLADQNAAGAFMWVAAALPMWLAMVGVLTPMLDLSHERASANAGRGPGRSHSGVRSRSRSRRRFAWRELLRSHALRRVLQVTVLGLALLIVVDGFFGDRQISALNLAGVLPWTYWRGLVVIGLLLVGNLFCAVCPFTLSRSLAGRWLGSGLRWPRILENKWLAVILLVAYLWAYEAFALWDDPLWTAWIIVGYFVACFAIESLFPRGSFCRHVCPIGQFNFLGAGISPLEVGRRDASICATCRTHDCLQGRDEAPGCPTGLFLPSKRGSLDCTFCLDCVRACPHDNAGLVVVNPGAALGTGRAARRLDVAALMLVFCFGAFANAAFMVAPVAGWERILSTRLGFQLHSVWVAWGMGLALVVVPIVAVLACSFSGRLLGGVERPLRALIVGLVPMLVPIGFAMWLAHFGFHLATGIWTLGPAVARAANDAGLEMSAHEATRASLIGAGSLEGLEIAVLGVGLVVSIAVAWRLSLRLATRPRAALGIVAPWAALVLALYVLGVWILLQPMQMRGMQM